MSRVLIVVLVLLLARTGAAQTYVSASLVGDIARFSHAEVGGVEDDGEGGEALGFALRLGTSIGPAWGVEAEFARPATIENVRTPQVIPYALNTDVFDVTAPGALIPNLPDLFRPIIQYRVRTELRNTTFAASAWARQNLSARLALVYLAGMSFYRSDQRIEFDFGGFLANVAPALPRVTEVVSYGVRPLAGFEAWINMTDRVQLVPGVRIQGLEAGWLIRPSAGLAWTF